MPLREKGRKCIHQPPNHGFPPFLLHHLDFISEHLHHWPHWPLTARFTWPKTAGRQRHRQSRLHYREPGQSLCCGLLLLTCALLLFSLRRFVVTLVVESQRNDFYLIIAKENKDIGAFWLYILEGLKQMFLKCCLYGDIWVHMFSF